MPLTFRKNPIGRKSDRIAKKCFSRFKNTCTSPVEVYSDESSKKSNNDEGVSSEQDEYYEREKQRRKKKKVICISSSSGFKGKGVESKRNAVGIGKKVLKRQREDHLTRRRGTKKKQKIDEEDVSDLDVEWFSIVNRCSPKQLVKGLGILKPKQRKAVEDMGFGKLLQFKVNGIPLKIGHYVVDKLDVSTMQILGRQGPVEVNQDAVFRLLGIPNRGIDLKNVNPTRNLSTKLQDTMVECHAHGKCKIDVLNYMDDETDITIVKKCQDEPDNDMVRVMAIKYERIFNEKPCVVEGVKEKEVQKNNDETCQTSNEVFDTSLADDIDETIMGLCLEINQRRQRWIESEDEEDPVDLGKVDTTIRADQIDFINNHGNAGTKVSVDKERINLNRELLNEQLPSFSLGLTQESNEEGSNQIKGKGLSENMKAGVVCENVTLADHILLEINSANVPKQGRLKDIENEVVQDSCMKAVMLKDEIPTFSLGLTQEVRQEETNKFTGQREIGDDKTMTFVADKMNAADGKMMGRSKSEIVAEKFGASGAMNEGINAPRPKLGRWTKADILAEKRKAMAKIEAKKGDSENKIKVEPKQGLMNQNVSEKEASKTIDQTVVVKSKRLKGVSRECKSPYLLREVEITNRCNKEENSVWDYIVKLSDEEVIFETSNGTMTEAKFFKTLVPGNRIYGELIDCWATVLNAEEKLRSPDSPYRLFCGHRVFKHMFVRYLEKFQHPRADKISMQKVTRVDLQWATIGNITDCGIFAMRHMEMFMGSHCRNFDCGFKTSEKQVRSQIQTLRKKYACRILLSDINVQKQKLLAKVGL
ncbi:hypothetical protein E3N88_23131 [Mikania micrantha]|uniref:Ubiquitin-like protease family profile domain-containing protein n=1 Tax=Mikania micrantha TaxID=192012 RepID=A0A5N6NE66_9ASTR|nr:hypothetical protein E3N88_23131 [Mikania micrantha]